MKDDDSGHFGPTQHVPPAGDPDPIVTKDGMRISEVRESLARTGNLATRYIPLPATLEARATGWHTIPKPIRFAVWVWAILVIVGVISAAVGALVWAIAMLGALSQL